MRRCWCSARGVSSRCMLGFYDGEEWRSIDSVRLPEEVTHWMDTPEPPEYQEEEE